MDNSFVRLPFVARASLSAGGATRQALICNLSVHGLFLRIPAVPEGELSIRFHLPDAGPLVEAKVALAWVNDALPDSVLALPAGCGVRFIEIAAGDEERIRRLVNGFQLAPEPVLGLVQPRSGCVRIPLVSPCTLAGPFGLARGWTCNLSSLGVYAAVERIPDIGDTVHVELMLPGLPAPFERAGTVTWQNPERRERTASLPPGCGLRLRNLSEDDFRLLNGLVEQYLASLPLAL